MHYRRNVLKSEEYKTTITRRKFIKDGLFLGLSLPLLTSGLSACHSNHIRRNSKNKKLNILILGGTSFLGPHQIAYALSRGHSITTFTRGKTKPSIYQEQYEQVEQLIGDRANNLNALQGRRWDVVIDNSGRDSEWTRQSANLLKNQADLYVYISSTGVYYPYLQAGIDENTPVLTKDPVKPITKGKTQKDSYGVMKAKSELATINAFGENRSIIVRPTYMIGPADQTDRFIYWPVRLSRGGEIMVPGKPTDPVQYIDVRDVAEWVIHLAETHSSGIYNAVGPEKPQSMSDFIDKAKKSFDVDSRFVFIEDYQFLAENKIYGIIPWLLTDENYYGSARIDNTKAIHSGLQFRDLSASIKDTYQWWISDALTAERRNQFELKPGSILMNEKSLLERWKNR